MVRASSRGGVPVFNRPAHQAQIHELVRERGGGVFPDPATADLLLAPKEPTAEEGARCYDQRAAFDRLPRRQRDAGDVASGHADANDLSLDDGHAGTRDLLSNESLIMKPIRLDARAVDGAALTAIEEPVVNPGGIGGARHQPVEDVQLADKMSLADAPDRRIA